MERMGVGKESNENTPLFSNKIQGQHRSFKSSRKSTRQQNKSLTCIILIVVLERTVYYSLLANLVLFLANYIQLSESSSASITLAFIGILWVMCVLGGYIADRWTGKFRILWISFLFYIFAYCAMPLLAVLTATNYKDQFERLQNEGTLPIIKGTLPKALCISALFLIALSEAVYKANIAPFGADQLHDRSEKVTRNFFNWYYWCVNVGSLIAYSLFAFVQQNIDKGFFYGYLVPVILLIIAFIVLMVGRKSFRSVPSTGSIFSVIWGVTKEAYKKRKTRADGDMCSSYEYYRPVTHWLDRAMVKYGGSHLECDVEEVKSLCKIIPIFILLIPYWALYWQMQATFIVQGIHMEIPLFHTYTFPAASLNLFEIVVVLLVIPLMDKVIYPFLDRRGCHMPAVARISLGMLFASAAMILAGCVEMLRVVKSKDISNLYNQTINGKTFEYPKGFSIFYQIPQYCIFGISEVFASVAGLEFAYRQAPVNMKGFVMGLFYASSGLGSLLGSGFFEMCLVFKWVNKKDKSKLRVHLDYYFFFLGGIMFVSWFVFLWFAKRYRIGYTSPRQSYVVAAGPSITPSQIRTPEPRTVQD